VAIGAAMLLFGACGPCGGTSSVSSPTGGGCAHPGVCLTLTGPLAGATAGLVQAPDCIPGGGLDAVFTTHVAGRETSIEILITDDSAKASPGFHPGTFQVKTRGGTMQGTGYATVWVKPDNDVAGYPGGWSTNGAGSSGTVVIDGHEGGSVRDLVATPASGSGTALHVSGTFNCR
jgi:hypothetical protein